MRQRRIFFQYVLGSRRRQIRKWEEASVAQLFAIPNEFSLLRQRAQSSRLRLAIEDKGIPFYDAFRLFDHALNGLLSPAELWGALEWLGFNVAPDDVLDFMRSADKDNDGYISYREFTDMIRQPYDDEGGVETSALGSPTATGVGHLSVWLIAISTFACRPADPIRQCRHRRRGCNPKVKTSSDLSSRLAISRSRPRKNGRRSGSATKNDGFASVCWRRNWRWTRRRPAGTIRRSQTNRSTLTSRRGAGHEA
ncbi:hypothetical protein PBRA_009625 [Plasmodiophora brassicae]|uniref:EF-hand domain-containing protein n=1 Tax=Plasmodiophora brassicae TaxID=37360 RepID=A0A0G4IIU0_PLABS|nr:hypothetical protein PBRA_009625 [Plasmodiophora brassicae]